MKYQHHSTNLSSDEQIILPVPQGDDHTGGEPGFESVGRPWRYVFPHQPTSSDPESLPDFTVPVPGSESIPSSGVLPGPRLVSRTATPE